MDEIAHEILAALRMGSVPAVGLSRLSIGRERELAELDERLDYVAQGKSALKFVCGDFGSGKSFFSALVREHAFEKGFASSSVVISPDSPLAKLDIIVGKTFDGLRLPEKRTASALSDLLERWLLNLLNLHISHAVAKVGFSIASSAGRLLRTSVNPFPGFSTT